VAAGLSILALVTDAHGGYGGIAQYNRDLFRALADSPVVSRILALPRVGQHSREGLPPKLVHAKPRRSRIAYSLSALAALRQQGPFDVIFCGHIYHSPLAAALSRWSGARLWLQAHGVDAWDCRSPLTRFAVARADLVTAVSRFTRRRLLDWAGLPADRVRVLPNTIRPQFAPGPANPATLAKFGLAGARIVLTVSRIDPADAYKGHARVIGAMGAILRAEPRAVYVVVGDGAARPELERRAAGLGRAVRFLGRLADEDVLDLYRSADLLAMPSTKEGFGIVFVEAAATGLPVIAGDLDGSVDALAEGAIGRLIDPRSVADIAAAVIDALQRRPPPAVEAAQRFAYENFAQHVDALVRTFRA
jgi:phosphatidylinositol alpha-1,6-mannosyltransferase